MTRENLILISYHKTKQMGKLTPKPYRQFNRLTNEWVWVYPKPTEYNENRLVKLDNLIPEPYKPIRWKRK